MNNIPWLQLNHLDKPTGDYMTYYETAEGMQITHERALQEIGKHSLLGDLEYFYQELGKQDAYQAQDVLDWLGY